MRQFGIIGRPLGHSASAAYFAEKFTDEGLNDHIYSRFELASIDELPELLTHTPDLCGLNVTLPYKQSVIPLLDQLSFEARGIGAVNCIRRLSDGSLTGHNTDIIGLRAALDELLQGDDPEEALVLGTGGASQAVQYALTERGIAYSLI